MENGDEPVRRNDTDKYTVCEKLLALFNIAGNHKALLTHPVISSFLEMKWKSVSSIFYLHLALYLTFSCSFTAFALHEFGGSSHPMMNNTNNVFKFNNALNGIISILKCLLLVLIALLLFWEILQISRDPKSYIQSKENWLEIFILSSTTYIVIMQWISEYQLRGNRHLAAFCIVMIWAEFLLLLGRHPG